MGTDQVEGSESEAPPTPDGVPVLGNGWTFSRNPVAALEEWAELGDVVRIQTPGQSTYVVTHPALIERILVDEPERFTISEGQRETFRGVEDHAVTTTTGERWKRLRRALHPAFTPAAIESYADDVVATTAARVDEWGDGAEIDLYRELRLLTVDVLADALLDVDLRGDEAVVMDAADALVDRANFRRPGNLLPDWVPTPTDRRFERTVGALDEFVEGVLDDREAGETGADLCSRLLEAHEAGALTRAEVRSNLVAMLLAGHDSPSTALTSAWYLLDDRPEVRESIRAEYEDAVDGDATDGDVTGGDGRPSYDDLEYTRRVVDEVLRLYPPTLGVSRQTTEPLCLGGYDLPAGAQLLLPQWVVHRDERFWDEPSAFRPSRWVASGDRPEYAYFPFSGGPRDCIGRKFARAELTLALATMVSRVDLDVAVHGELSFTPSLALRPEQDVTAVVRRR